MLLNGVGRNVQATLVATSVLFGSGALAASRFGPRYASPLHQRDEPTYVIAQNYTGDTL